MHLKSHHDEMPQLNLTSMIDVLFLLIIFFMLATRFADMERDLAVQVPRVGAHGAPAAMPARHVINVYRDGHLALDGKRVTAEELTAALTAARRTHQDVGAIVRGDGNGAFQNVATVLNACRRAGISDLGISVSLAQGEPAAGGTTRR